VAHANVEALRVTVTFAVVEQALEEF
jgi:hypothetical protein